MDRKIFWGKKYKEQANVNGLLMLDFHLVPYLCPIIAVTNYHKLSDLKQYKVILL